MSKYQKPSNVSHSHNHSHKASLALCAWLILTGPPAVSAQTQSIIIDFPKRCLGRLYEVKPGMECYSHENIYGKFIGPAEGKIKVPSGSKLVLEIDQRTAIDGDSPLPDTNYAAITAMRIRQAEKSDALIKFLAKQTSLMRLDLMDCECSDEAISKLSGLTKMRYLSVRNGDLNGDCLQKLGTMRDIVTLNCSSNTLHQSAFRSIANFKHLTKLDVARCGMNDEGLIYLSKNNSIEDLNLNNNGAITVRGLRALGANKRLKILRLLKTSITLSDILNNMDGQRFTEIGVDKKPTLAEYQNFKKKYPDCRVGWSGHASEFQKNLFAPVH